MPLALLLACLRGVVPPPGGDSGPTRAGCAAALAEHMPELVPVHRRLTRLAGAGNRAARVLSTWCPPPYLGGCSLAARADGGTVPGRGMVEFLWGLSDGVNAAGLSVVLAFGGRSEVARGSVHHDPALRARDLRDRQGLLYAPTASLPKS